MLTQPLLDKTTLFLFNSFPREVGKTRKRIYNIQQLVNFIEQTNSIDEVYTSVYSLDFIIDKLFLDFDTVPNVRNALDDAKALARYYESEKFQYIPIASGRKGIHLYLILKPKLYENSKQLLTAVTIHIIEQVFDKNEITTIDTHLVGNLRALCRIPNSLRPPENLNYCTYLPPDKFLDMTEEDIAIHMKQPHIYNYEIDIQKCPILNDFDVDIEEYKNYQTSGNNSNGYNLTTNIKNIKDIKAYLKNILRPCLFSKITTPDPRHDVRVITTIDLLKLFNKQQIAEIYQRLNWKDFDFLYTLYQIEKCEEFFKRCNKFDNIYHCKRLKQLGIPTVCCDY